MNNEELEQRITNVLHPYLFEDNNEETRNKIAFDLTEEFKDVGYNWGVIEADNTSYTFGATLNGDVKLTFSYKW